MLQKDVVLGGVYKVRIGSNPFLSNVRIDTEIADRPTHRKSRTRWYATNLATNRVIIVTAARLRSKVGTSVPDTRVTKETT